MKRTLVLTAAIAAALFTSPSLAGTPKARVSYGDLNLATLEGQAELQKRLDKAARKVCRFGENGMVVTAEQENACYRVSRKEAAIRMAQVVQERQLGG